MGSQASAWNASIVLIRIIQSGVSARPEPTAPTTPKSAGKKVLVRRNLPPRLMARIDTYAYSSTSCSWNCPLEDQKCW
ncbi:hypothetical protein C8Q77DRAFT_1140801 [Trametes polyzona]|nr:hypothetical protein C8Q77DRAFT_1140801 [Trametes polyzona]